MKMTLEEIERNSMAKTVTYFGPGDEEKTIENAIVMMSQVGAVCSTPAATIIVPYRRLIEIEYTEKAGKFAVKLAMLQTQAALLSIDDSDRLKTTSD